MTEKNPPTDAEMLGMGYTPYDIECIKEFSPAFNSDVADKRDPAAYMLRAPLTRSQIAVRLVAIPLGMVALLLVIWMAQ